MAFTRTLVVILAALIGTPVVAPASAGTSEAQARRPSKRKQVQRKKHKRPPPRRARSLATSVSRPSLPADRGRTPTGNSAPAGDNADERRLQQRLDDLVGSRWLKTGINGVHVRDVKTGRVLYAYGDDRQLNIASNAKLVATATALDQLGGDFTYATRVVGAEPDADGVVHGDLYLVGSWDPTLGYGAIAELARGLADRGVRRVTGDLVVRLGDRDAVVSSRVSIDIVAGDRDGDLPAVTLTPDTALFVVDTTAETARKVRKPKVEVSGRWLAGADPAGTQDRFVITIAGKLRPGERLRAVRGVPRPALMTAHVLRAQALGAGIVFDGGVRQEDAAPPTEAATLAEHASVPMRVIAAKINKPSNNFLADRVIMTVGGHRSGGDPAMQKGVEAMADWLGRVGVPVGSYRLENGSGLSYVSHMSARQIADVLVAGAADPEFGADFVHSLAVGGVDGTLRSRFIGRRSRGDVRGKTGTLTGVAALSGFVSASGEGTEDGLVFAILTNEFRNRRKLSIRAAQADIVDALHDHLEARRSGKPVIPPPAVEQVEPVEEPAEPEPEPAPSVPVDDEAEDAVEAAP